MNESWSALLAKAIGAIAGAGLSIAIFLPKSPREAAIQFFSGLFVGLVFGQAAAGLFELYIGVDIGPTRLMAGGFLAGFGAWSLLVFALGILKRARSVEDLKNGGHTDE